jgi:hypothetical protein
MGTDRERERDEILRRLAGLVSSVDPTPERVTEFARNALAWRRVDAELAEIREDSALQRPSLAYARSGRRDSRTLVFAADDLEIDVQIDHRDTGVVVLGQLTPATGASVELQRDDTSIAAGAEADDLGRFRLELSSGGRMRLLVVLSGPDPAPAFETSWLTI